MHMYKYLWGDTYTHTRKATEFLWCSGRPVDGSAQGHETFDYMSFSPFGF